MTTAKRISYLLFALLVVGAVWLRLGPVALAGLFSYMILDLTHRRLAPRMPEWAARTLSIIIFTIISVGIFWMLVVFLRLALIRMPVLLGTLIPKIDSLAGDYGVELPFENLHELKAVTVDAVRENARSVTQVSRFLTKGFFHIILSIFVAVFCFLSEPQESASANLFESVRREFGERIKIFMQGFEKILGAQVLIACINTGLTAIFLVAMGFPYIHFLALATFIFGVLPIIGNVISNTIIVGTALTLSFHLALISLAFLILIHKLEYFLNSQILGSRMNMPVWHLLLGLLIGEAVMGVPGIILAPAMLHYVREELQSLPAKRP